VNSLHPLFARALGALVCGLLLVAAARLVPVGHDNSLNLYIWSAYLAPDTLAGFERRHGVKVNLDTYDSNEAVLAKLQAGNVDYDLVVPTDYMVQILIREKLLREIDKGSLKNFKNLSPEFLNLPFDPGNLYSIPYIWGATGIGYRKDKVQGPVDSWKVLWDARYKDRILMLDDMRENFSAALKTRGRSANSTDPAELAEAKLALMEQKPLLKAYNSGNFQEMLLSGDAWLAQGFNGQVAKAMKEAKRDELGFVIPREGSLRSLDSLCIPRGAPHPDLAHLFIDYLLEAEVSAAITNFTHYPAPNQAARPFLAPDVRDNPAIFPPEERLRNCEYATDVGAAVNLYDQAWTEVKSR
jgi:spermidine/putrescine-binding protein